MEMHPCLEINMSRYWKFISVLPGVVLILLLNLDIIDAGQHEQWLSAVGAIIAALGPLVSPANAPPPPPAPYHSLS